jgi:3-hydroxybutyryl-CoA dehydrogenase
MRLVEVIPALQSGEHAVQMATAVGEAMGKRVILAADGPGFLVNRCGRPFYAEALRLLQERIATHDQIDRICRMAGGFRMGPFELMDLVGIDVGFAVAKSFMELSFGEPRWKPNPLQARMAAAGRLGRKTGRGWYEYGDGPHRPDDPEPPPQGGGDGRVVAIFGAGAIAVALRDCATAAGFDVIDHPDDGAPILVVDADRTGDPPTGRELYDDESPLTLPLATLCFDDSLAWQYEREACGFNLLPPEAGWSLVELTRLPGTPEPVAQLTEDFFRCCGFHPEWVGDAPGLVLGRIVCQLVNEGAFAVGEGVGSREDVDAGLELGLNHPRGAFGWGELIGFHHVNFAMERLWEQYREERYRAAPLLHRLAIFDEGSDPSRNGQR